MTSTSTAPVEKQDENRLIAERREKLNRLREKGQAYPNDFRPDHQAAELHDQFGDHDKESLADLGKHVKIAGRMMLKRVMGKASFATIQDGSGRIQLYLDKRSEEHTSELQSRGHLVCR